MHKVFLLFYHSTAIINLNHKERRSCAVENIRVKPQDVDDLIFGGSEERTVSER